MSNVVDITSRIGKPKAKRLSALRRTPFARGQSHAAGKIAARTVRTHLACSLCTSFMVNDAARGNEGHLLGVGVALKMGNTSCNVCINCLSDLQVVLTALSPHIYGPIREEPESRDYVGASEDGTYHA